MFNVGGLKAFSIVVALCLISAFAASVSALEMEVKNVGSLVFVRCSWNPPQSGGAVIRYHLQFSVNDGPWHEVGNTVETEYVALCTPGDTYKARVRGWNHSGFGPLSNPSSPYTPDLALPGAPGAPIIH